MENIVTGESTKSDRQKYRNITNSEIGLYIYKEEEKKNIQKIYLSTREVCVYQAMTCFESKVYKTQIK
jgi:hypothetical protein